MSDKEQTLPATDCARRRLIRGAFGVPAVLTVASGGVAAASNVNCIAQIGTFPLVYPGASPPTTDSIIRIRVYKAANLNYVQGKDVLSEYRACASGSFMSSTQVWQFDVTANQTVGVPSSPPNATLQEQDLWAALRFNANGCLVGVGDGGDGGPSGNAITGSCWNSFG